MKLRRTTHMHTHKKKLHVILVKFEQVLWIAPMSTSKFDMYCIYVSIGGKLGIGYTGLCCTVFFNFLWIYTYLKIKCKMRLIVYKREHDFVYHVPLCHWIFMTTLIFSSQSIFLFEKWRDSYRYEIKFENSSLLPWSQKQSFFKYCFC